MINCNRDRPVCWAMLWIAIVYTCIEIIIYKLTKSSSDIIILTLLFLATLPLPSFLFPSIITSVRVGSGCSDKRNKKKSISKCKNGPYLMVDGRTIYTGPLPAQVKVYCARRSSYKVYLCHDNTLYHEDANLYEEHTCSVEIVAEEKT